MSKHRPAPSAPATSREPAPPPAPELSGRPETSPDVPTGEGATPAIVPPAPEALPPEGSHDAPPAGDADDEGETDGPSPGEPPAPRPRWRDVAVCVRATSCYFGGALVKLLGGEWVEERERVEVVRGDTSFRVFPVESPEHLAELRADYQRELARVRRDAAALGFVLFRDGEIDPARRR
ncbi:MAG: hypothetical protein JWM10_3020 [Myxococcaceae bacterium]|nr:hypothetical protein [Myxococcaceae bacterium]